MTTTNDLAKQIRCNVNTVQKWCQKLQFEKTGRDYLLTDYQVALIKSNVYKHIGRPKNTYLGVDRQYRR